VPFPLDVKAALDLNDEADKYFAASKTLTTPAHRRTVFKFVRDQFPQARFSRIYDASTDGWDAKSFHRCCDRQGWTLTLVKTTADFIFGGFTTAEWESVSFGLSKPSDWASSLFGTDKPDPRSFLFSVNEGAKYPNTGGDSNAIKCDSDYCAMFGTGGWDMWIKSDSNQNAESGCRASKPSFMLPPAMGEGCESDSSTINGGKYRF
jgi:hypothetical protein